MTSLDCARLDELAGAYALHALEPQEEWEISQHLRDCTQAHAPIHEALETSTLMAAALPPERADPRLRARILASVAALDAEQYATEDPRRPAARGRLPLPTSRATALMATVALAAVVAVAVVGIGLSAELGRRDAQLRAIASADAVYTVRGDAGRGLLAVTEQATYFVPSDLTPLAGDRLYALWLIGADGVPVAVGTFRSDGADVIQLERSAAGFEVFAVTVEQRRVDQPTGDPVLAASLTP